MKKTIDLDNLTEVLSDYGHADTPLCQVLSGFMVDKIINREASLEKWLGKAITSDNEFYTNPTFSLLINKDINLWFEALHWVKENAPSKYKTLTAKKGDLLSEIGKAIVSQDVKISDGLRLWLSDFVTSTGMKKWVESGPGTSGRVFACIGILNVVFALEKAGDKEMSDKYFGASLKGLEINNYELSSSMTYFWTSAIILIDKAKHYGKDVEEEVHQMCFRRVVEVMENNPTLGRSLLDELAYGVFSESCRNKIGFSEQTITLFCEKLKEMDVTMDEFKKAVCKNKNVDRVLLEALSLFEVTFLKISVSEGKIAKKFPKSL